MVAGQFEKTGETIPLKKAKLLSPVAPSKMVNFGRAYTLPGQSGNVMPSIFFKPPSAIIADGEFVVYPSHLSEYVKYEAELALIISKTCYRVPADEAMEYVFAYTCHNDITASDLSGKDPTNVRGKSCDTFAPLGPWMVTGIDPHDLHVQLKQNGELRQDARISDMTYEIPYLISMVSQVMTLNPGDVIATGTPPGGGPIAPGDTLEVIIEKIGTLTNFVKE